MPQNRALAVRSPKSVAARKPSLRTRLGLGLAGLVAVAMALFGIFVYADLDRGLDRGMDDSLRVNATLAASTVAVSAGQVVLGESRPEKNSALEVSRDQGYTVRYIDADGAVIDGFGLLWDAPPDLESLATAARDGSALSDATDLTADEDYRVYTLPLLEGEVVVGFVQVLRSMDSIGKTLQHLFASLWIGGAFLTVAAGLAGYFLARRALAPIDAITQTARRISGQDLSARLRLSGPDDEVGRLASTLDEMLERLEQSFQRERRFSADASHELRTPLAAMEAILGVVRCESRSTDDYEKALDDLTAETGRLRDLVERLLELARSWQPAANAFAPVDVSSLVEDVVDVLRPLAQAKALILECHLESGLTVRGDGDSLIRLFLNLVENAIKFTERGVISVSALSRAGDVTVEVSDTGLGIAADRLPYIYERFYRADPSRSTPGAGLGLALARQIALNHGGTLTAQSREGEGSTFTVTLPSRPE
jgi:signal transduction histidine kinase